MSFLGRWLLAILIWAIGAVVVVVFGAYCLTLYAIHRGSLVLCWFGFHGGGCWLRERITIPALLEVKRFSAGVRKHFGVGPRE